jgi:uncharacterized integral membrane protein (TIGR00698 family)
MTEKTSQMSTVSAQATPSDTKPGIWAGLVVVLVVGGASWLLAGVIPRLGSVTIAILLGMLVGNLLPNMARYAPGVTVAEKRLLPAAIALLGVELQLMLLIGLGPLTLGVILASVAVALLTSVYVGRWMGYSLSFSLLMGAGNGICGSSAVAATSAAIKAEGKDIGISISVVNLLGTLGIFLMPPLVALLGFNEAQGGMLIGGSLQAVGQVVAAGFTVTDTVGSVATAVKMGRVLMLGPVVILLGTLMSRRQNSSGQKAAPIRVPLFILGFFALSVLTSLGWLPETVVVVVKTAGKMLLVVAMAGIGMRIQLQTLYRSGPMALLFGAIVSTVQVIVIIGLIVLLG